jgi:hypothetical protein
LFAAELPQFGVLLPPAVVAQMQEFRSTKAAEVKQLKQAKAEAKKRKLEQD